MTNLPARTRANRLNALHSTGPRTPAGQARSSQNAVTVGLFSRHIVLPALGESEAEFDAFRTGIITDLDPVGALETELADRVAQLVWRMRRVVRYETAAQTVPQGALPPHPDQVPPDTGHPYYHPLPADAPVAARLARLRGGLQAGPRAIETRRAALAALDAVFAQKLTGKDEPATAVPVATTPGLYALGAVADELGWTAGPEVWRPILDQLGFKRAEPSAVEWTVSRLRRVVLAAARTANRPVGGLADAARGRLLAEIEDREHRITEQRAEEATLAAELLRDREAAAAARLYADGGVIERVVRAESHLSRELDRTLALLGRLRMGRNAQCPCDAPVGRSGFVLGNGVSPASLLPVPGAEPDREESP